MPETLKGAMSTSDSPVADEPESTSSDDEKAEDAEEVSDEADADEDAAIKRRNREAYIACWPLDAEEVR